MDNGGIPMAESYGPYRAMEGECQNGDIIPESRVTNMIRIPRFSPESSAESTIAMKMAIWKHGPVVANIHATKQFTGYLLRGSGEIFQDRGWYVLCFFFGSKYVNFQ